MVSVNIVDSFHVDKKSVIQWERKAVPNDINWRVSTPSAVPSSPQRGLADRMFLEGPATRISTCKYCTTLPLSGDGLVTRWSFFRLVFFKQWIVIAALWRLAGLGRFVTALALFTSSTAVDILGRPVPCFLLRSTPVVCFFFRTFQIIVVASLNVGAIALINVHSSLSFKNGLGFIP